MVAGEHGDDRNRGRASHGENKNDSVVTYRVFLFHSFVVVMIIESGFSILLSKALVPLTVSESMDGVVRSRLGSHDVLHGIVLILSLSYGISELRDVAGIDERPSNTVLATGAVGSSYDMERRREGDESRLIPGMSLKAFHAVKQQM